MGQGSSRQLCLRDGSHCHSDEAGGQGPDGGRAWLIGVTLRLSAGGLRMPHATILLRSHMHVNDDMLTMH